MSAKTPVEVPATVNGSAEASAAIVPAESAPAEKPLVVLSRDQLSEKIKAHKTSADQIRGMAPMLAITTNETYQWASKFLLAVKHEFEKIKAEKAEICAPHTNFVRIVNALYGPALKAFEEAEATIKAKIVEYNNTVDASRVAEMEAGLQVSQAPAEAAGVQIRQTMDFEIVNADAVDRQFCSPDRKKIQAYLDNGGIAAIYGVRFFPKSTVFASKKGVQE